MAGKKLLITGSGNDGFRHRYEIRKSEDFKEAFVGLMFDLGFGEFDFVDSIFMTEKNYQENKGRDVKVSHVSDALCHYKNKEFEVEIFYGVKKIFLIIRTKKRDKLIKIIDKYSKWTNSNTKKSIKKRK